MEGASNVAAARGAGTEPSREALLRIHAMIFSGRAGAGEFRNTAVSPLYRGQDCPEPQFISRSVDNFSSWLTAESLNQIHPIEKAALVLARIVDIWPFEFGNLTMAIIFANLVLQKAGFGPFFVLPEHMKEVNAIVGQAMSIETQPLVNAIHRTIKREMETVASR
jgi:fido (protein-threonine AMPylation protein)